MNQPNMVCETMSCGGSKNIFYICPIDLDVLHKGHSLCKQCLHDLQFMKKGSSSLNLSKLARADISCQFMKKNPCAELFTK
jgi:hypothetical protein